MPDQRRYAEDDRYEDERPRSAAVREWSPAQIIGMIVGIGFAVLGIAAVSETGFDTSDFYQPQEEVWGLTHSPLLGLAEIGFGVLMIVASVVPGGLRTLMGFLGAVALVFGLVILFDAAESDMTRWFGVDNDNGWLYTIVGGVVLLAAFLSPVFVGDTRRRSRRHPRSGAVRSPA